MENSKIKFSANKRQFVMVYHDFIKCKFLNWNEKDLYIILSMYADKGKKCFPSISTLCEVSGKSKSTVIRGIEGLKEKKLLKKEERITKNGQISNLYILYDFKELGNVDNSDEVITTVGNKDDKQVEKQEQDAIKLLESMGYTVSKEKGLESAPAKEQNQAPNSKPFDVINTTSNSPKSQAERYPLKRIRKLFDYDAMVNDNPYRDEDIDSVMDILHDAMNTTKGTVRVAGEDKPTNVVIGKLMKLDKDSIMYAINKFSEQTERVRNPASYMLTVLYTAPEQYRLDLNNQVRHNMAHWVDKRKKQNEYSRPFQVLCKLKKPI